MEFNIELLQNGLTILCVGFFIVFLFLTIMIFAMDIMGKIVQYLNKVFPVDVPLPAAGKKSSTASADEEIAVAIAAVLMK